MALKDTIRAAVGTLKTVLSDGGLLVPVQHYAYQSQNEFGEPSYGATPTTRHAIVESTTDIVRDPVRGEIVARLVFMFLDDFPITTRDKLVLPDGTFTPLLSVDEGVLDDQSGNFYVRVLVE